jgi:hypothetical protein
VVNVGACRLSKFVSSSVNPCRLSWPTVRPNAIGLLCSSNSLYNIPGPLPLPLHDGIIGLSARCEPSCGQSLSTYCSCLLSSNDTLSLHPFLSSLCLVFRQCCAKWRIMFFGDIRKSGLASIMRYITPSLACSENGLSAMRRHASRNSQYAGHRVVEDQCPPPWSRRLPAPQDESYGPSRQSSWLRSACPSFSILRNPIPHRHEFIQVNCIPDEYSGYLEDAGPEDRDDEVTGVK